MREKIGRGNVPRKGKEGKKNGRCNVPSKGKEKKN